MDFLLFQALSGITFAAILFLLSSGLSLIFGVMRIINITHGSFYMVGGYIGVSVMRATGNFWLALLGGTLSMGVLGLAVERGFLSKYYRDTFPQILITIGFALILKDVVFIMWGGDPYFLGIPKYLEGTFQLGIYRFSYFRTFTILFAGAIAFLLWAFIEKSTLGAKLRASVDDDEMATGVGINVPVVCALMFCLGSALAAMAGVLGSHFFGLHTNADFEFLPIAFAVVIVGGMGTLRGVIAGSILVGVVDTFGKALYPDLSYFTLFAPMAVVLAIKPAGLFGRQL